MPPRPLPKLRALPGAARSRFDLLLGGSRQHSLFDLPVTTLLERLGGNPATSFIPERCWLQATQTAQIGSLAPAFRPDRGAPDALVLVLHCASVAREPLARAVFWLQTLEQPQTLREIKELAGHYWRYPQPKQLAEQLTALPASELQAQAEPALAALRFLTLQAGRTEQHSALSATGSNELTAAGEPATSPRSLWQHLEAIYGFGLIFCALRWPLRALSRDRAARGSGSWRRFARPEQAPAEPLEGYRLLVAEKHVDGETIRFGCAGYAFERKRGWQRIGSVQLPGVDDSLPSVFSTDTPIEQLSAAWADFVQAIGQLNERRYQNMLAGLERSNQQRQAELHESTAQREQLRQGAETAELLPGGPTIVRTSAARP